jgi:hypothetical protein
VDIAPGSNGLVVSWPTSRPAFSLQAAEAGAAMNWLTVAQPGSTNGRRNVVVLENEAGGRFFRLKSSADP